jgi:hypothetical protein
MPIKIKIASSTSYLGGADFLTTLGLLNLKCVARISTDATDCKMGFEARFIENQITLKLDGNNIHVAIF